MNTHLIIWPILLAFSITQGVAQTVKYQTDKHIVHQQERMVFKQWNRDKFTPKKGFLGLNYQYWLTWAWHPNYPRTDRRPLSFTGPQTLRLRLVAAMKNTEEAYKKHADTLRNTALRSEEHTSELQSLMRNSYAVFCLKKKTTTIFTLYK